MKKYQLAGLDFIIDQNGQPFFIEANSLPGFYKQQLTDDNKIQTLKKLFGRKLIILTPKEKKLTKRQINLMQSITETFVAYNEDNHEQWKTIKDRKGKIHESGALLVWNNLTKKNFSKKFRIINAQETCQLIKNKIRTAELMKQNNIPIPKTFAIENANEIPQILKENSIKNYVLKPIFGSKGDDITFHQQSDKIQLPPRKMLLQEQIILKKLYNRYWDLRALVINGKYIGAIKRSSKSPATNISKGGRINKAPIKFQKIIAPLAEKIVALYEKNS